MRRMLLLMLVVAGIGLAGAALSFAQGEDDFQVGLPPGEGTATGAGEDIYGGGSLENEDEENGAIEHGTEQKEMKTVEGEIVTKDTVALTIDVKWLEDAGEENYDQNTFLVPEDTLITSNAGNIGFSGLNMGDRVVITYYKDAFDKLVAKTITVKTE